MLEQGEITAHVEFEKKETMMVAHFHVVGKVQTNCDRCNGPIEIPIDGAYRIVYKLGEDSSEDENLIILPFESYQIDVSSQMYEFIIVSLPTRILHSAGDCDEEMMAMYQTYILNANEPDHNPEDDWDEDDWDEENEEDEDENPNEDGEEEDDEDSSDPDNDKPIDPRWSILKNLN